MTPGERLRAILDSTVAKGHEKIVLVVLSDHMTSKKLMAWPSQARIAEKAGISARSVSRVIASLKSKRLLTVSHTGRGSLTMRISWSLLGCSANLADQESRVAKMANQEQEGTPDRREGYANLAPQVRQSVHEVRQDGERSREGSREEKQGTEAARARTREAPTTRNGPVTDQVMVPAPDQKRSQADDLPSPIYETLIPAAVEAEQPPPATPPSTPERGAHHHTDTNMAADASAPPAHPSRRQRKMLEAQQQRHQEQVKATGMRLFQPPPLDPAQALAKLEQLTAQRYDHEQIAAIMGDHDLAAAVYHSQQLEAEAKIIPLRQPETGP